MANDEVGVEPGRLAEAASALESLRNVLASNVPVIVRTMEEYWGSGAGTPVSLAPLKQAEARSVDDAAGMRDRSTLAQEWLAQHDPWFTPATQVVPISWGTSQQELDKASAAAAARLLAGAEARVKAGTPLSGPSAMTMTAPALNNPFSRGETFTATIATPMDQIAAVEQEMRDHSSDKAWLGGFWSQPGADTSAANLAATLNVPNLTSYGAPALTSADQKILSTVATSLAAACRLNALPSGQGQQLVAGFTKAAAGNPWSAAMLLKAGPSGSSYGTGANGTGANLLTGVTGQVLNAYAKGVLNIPLNYELSNNPNTSQLNAYMAANDPVTAMLTLAAQNKTAAQEVMAGYDPVTGKFNTATGQAWATLLLTKTGANDTYYTIGSALHPTMIGNPMVIELTPGSPNGTALSYGGDSYGIPVGTVANFLDASTAGPRGGGTLSNAEFSAYAAYNLINGTPPPGGDPGGISITEPLRQVLLHTAQRYTLDLGMSARIDGTSGGVFKPSSTENYWNFAVPGLSAQLNAPNALSSFLQQISSNKSDAATLDASAKVVFGNIYARDKLGELPPDFNGSMAENAMASLLGRIPTEANNVGVNLAADTDVRHLEYNALIKLVENSFRFVPTAFGVKDLGNKVLYRGSKEGFALADLLGIPDSFSTDNAIHTATKDAHNFAVQGTQIHVSMVQGLLKNGAKDLQASAAQYNQSLSPQQQWLKGSQIILTNQNDAQFEHWYETLPPALDQKYGLSSLENRFGYYYYQQGAAASQTGHGSSPYEQGGATTSVGASPW